MPYWGVKWTEFSTLAAESVEAQGSIVSSRNGATRSEFATLAGMEYGGGGPLAPKPNQGYSRHICILLAKRAMRAMKRFLLRVAPGRINHSTGRERGQIFAMLDRFTANGAAL